MQLIRCINGRNIKNGILIVLLFLPTIVLSQEKLSPNPGGYWLSYSGDNKINKRIGIHSEAQIRNAFLDRSVATYLVRTGLNVYFHPTAMGTVGYGFIYNDPSGDNVIGSETMEHRIWQQLLLRQKSRYIFMDHRFRLEQRFISNLSNKTEREDHRVRYRFQTLFPLYSISPHLRHLFVAVNNEIMINFRSNPSKLFDRNRFFVGIGYQVSPKLNFQLGYLNQFIHNVNSPVAQVDHILQVSIAYNMDDIMQTFFKRKKDI